VDDTLAIHVIGKAREQLLHRHNRRHPRDWARGCWAAGS
jgi:hypothetical protein